jgi:hypothetical protein
MLIFLTFKPLVYNVDIFNLYVTCVYCLVSNLLTNCVHDEGCALLLFVFFYIEIWFSQDHRWKWRGYHVVLAISSQLKLKKKNVFQFCVGILMLCINVFLNNRNCRYYEKKVLTLMVNHATYINEKTFLPITRQYLDCQRYMSCSLLESEI